MAEQFSTRFGAPRLPLGSAVGVLRGKAAAAGAALGAASTVDLAAAVVAADAWVALTGADSLRSPNRYGRAAVAVLAAVLARAAGCGGDPVEVSMLDCPSAPALLALADEHAAYVEVLLDAAADPADRSEVQDVLRRAASDLSAAGEGTVFAAYAALLTVVSATR